ncbi:MAG TPA: 4Fe-4S dicluster domain-containing protein [Planctomycetes bacterium]|nr:4Fe-4S dicluster domain-containing protein [Planctomycetota bacterium]
MAIDLDVCSGCGACVVACRSENNVPISGPGDACDGAALEWMSLIPRHQESESGSTLPVELLPTPCFHCENPPCVKVCPVNATYQNEEGLVAQIWDRCIGCRYCTVACPYSRRSFNWTEPEWPETYRNFLNPDVALRPEGVVEKCTFCAHRIRRVKEVAALEEREVVPEELEKLTACAEACPADAIIFGDLNDAASRVARMTRSPRAWRMHEELGTQPKVSYLTRDRREL